MSAPERAVDPAAGPPRSTTSVSTPRSARWKATLAPTTPAPTTSASAIVLPPSILLSPQEAAYHLRGTFYPEKRSVRRSLACEPRGRWGYDIFRWYRVECAPCQFWRPRNGSKIRNEPITLFSGGGAGTRSSS